VEISTGDVFPASFSDHGPDIILRHARLSHKYEKSYLTDHQIIYHYWFCFSFERESERSNKLHSIYNSENGNIFIPPFKVRAIPRGIRFVRIFLELL